jgi:hypothetical protein
VLLALPVAHLDGQGGPAVLEGGDIGEAPKNDSDRGRNKQKHDGHYGKELAKAQPVVDSLRNAGSLVVHDGCGIVFLLVVVSFRITWKSRTE